jgi:hypothetical protein
MADVIQLELDHILVTSNTGYRVRTISSPERSIGASIRRRGQPERPERSA